MGSPENAPRGAVRPLVALAITAMLLAGCGGGSHAAFRTLAAVQSCLRASGRFMLIDQHTRTGSPMRATIAVLGRDGAPGFVAFFRDAERARASLSAVPATPRRQAGTIVAARPGAERARASRPLTVEEIQAGAELIAMEGDGAARVALERCAFGSSAPASARTRTFTYTAPPPPAIPVPPRLHGAAAGQYVLGRRTVDRSGCLGCHAIGREGNSGPGADLGDVGDRLSPAAIMRALVDPRAPMPSFEGLPPRELRALVVYLQNLRTHG